MWVLLLIRPCFAKPGCCLRKWIHFDSHCVLPDSFGFANFWAVSVHKYLRTTHNGEIHKRSSNVPKQFSNNEERLFCLEESLEETLMKLSVDMFEKYHELFFITLKQNGLLFRCKIVSHFKALYYYRKSEYIELLNTCNSIISHEIFTPEDCEDRKHPKFLPDYHIQDMFCVSVLFAFQTFFKKDVICLIGLIDLILSMLDEETVIRTSNLHGQTLFRDPKFRGLQMRLFVTRVSCLFLVYFLRFQSLHRLHYQKSNILSALKDLKHANTGLVFEDILLMFVGIKLKRLQHWIIY